MDKRTALTRWIKLRPVVTSQDDVANERLARCDWGSASRGWWLDSALMDPWAVRDLRGTANPRSGRGGESGCHGAAGGADHLWEFFADGTGDRSVGSLSGGGHWTGRGDSSRGAAQAQVQVDKGTALITGGDRSRLVKVKSKWLPLKGPNNETAVDPKPATNRRTTTDSWSSMVADAQGTGWEVWR